MGAHRFAAEMKQPLHKFYSYDTWGSESDPADPSESKGRKKAKAGPQQYISAEIQEEIWNLTPKYTDNIPGVLELCIGMPVMIKFNEATELCVTNGQNGNVVGWTFEEKDNRKYLQTLFVRLLNPPKTIKIDGLPENIVPIARTTVSKPVTFPNGTVRKHKFKSLV